MRQPRRYVFDELKYYGTMLALVLMVPLTLGMMVCLLPSASATMDHWDVEGANGSLYVHGALTESACRLDMSNAYQDIALGEIGMGRLQGVGTRGESVRFELRLTDCLRSSARSRDVRTGALTWANNQPAVTVSFNATRDADNLQLVKAQGVSGLGLRVQDSQGGDVRLGSRGKPLLLPPGQDTLSYTVAAERTPASLVAGSYLAVVGFHLSYD